jgi:Family of unknown function (DUF6088)
MISSTAAEVRRRVLRSSDRFWHVEDFDGDPHPVVLELRRLVEAGELERVRRGVYWRGRKTRFGMAVPPAVEAVREIVGDGEAVGAAGWYATNVLGLSTQVSPTPVVAVTQRPPTGLRGVRLINRASRVGRRRAKLNEIEVTLLEALEGWERHVEVDRSEALDRFAKLLERDDVRVERLARAAETESPRVRERLRAVLAHAGLGKEAEKIERARHRSSRERALAVLND